jgi:hypothetical protein
MSTPATSVKHVSLRVFERELRAAGLWDESLIAAWDAQCASGTFSPAVNGLGTLRVPGKSGDAPLKFPRVTSLAVLDEPGAVSDAERYILRVTRSIVEASPAAGRTAMEVVPGQGDTPPSPTATATFHPQVANIVILPIVAGG